MIDMKSTLEDVRSRVANLMVNACLDDETNDTFFVIVTTLSKSMAVLLALTKGSNVDKKEIEGIMARYIAHKLRKNYEMLHGKKVAKARCTKKARRAA